jgi:hypothetical protein
MKTKTMPSSIVQYDPEALTLTQQEEASAVVIVVRDPDTSNDYTAWGKPFSNGRVWAVDVDLGNGDGGWMPEDLRDFAEMHRATADRLEKCGWIEAAEALRQIVHDQGAREE